MAPACQRPAEGELKTASGPSDRLQPQLHQIGPPAGNRPAATQEEPHDHPPRPTILTAGAIELDPAGRTCLRDGPVVELTRREYAILEYLSRHKGVVVPKADIIGHVWGFAFDGGDNVVEVHISALRRKLRSDLIDTVRGSGYRTTDLVRRPVADDTRARRWLLWPASDARWPPLTDDPPVATG